MAYQKKRSYQKKQEIGLTEGASCWLRGGFVLDHMVEPSEAVASKLWQLHRRDLIREYCRKSPGRMPNGFWCFDAPEEAAHDDRSGGFFAFRRETGKKDLQGHPIKETEHETLTRLGLLETVKALGYREPKKVVENMGRHTLH